jgi:hypothetical protein
MSLGKTATLGSFFSFLKIVKQWFLFKVVELLTCSLKSRTKVYYEKYRILFYSLGKREVDRKPSISYAVWRFLYYDGRTMEGIKYVRPGAIDVRKRLGFGYI